MADPRPTYVDAKRSPFERFDFDRRVDLREWIWVPQKYASVVAVKVLDSDYVESLRAGVDVTDCSVPNLVFEAPQVYAGIRTYRLRKPIAMLPAQEFGVTVLASAPRVGLVVTYHDEHPS